MILLKDLIFYLNVFKKYFNLKIKIHRILFFNPFHEFVNDLPQKDKQNSNESEE